MSPCLRTTIDGKQDHTGPNAYANLIPVRLDQSRKHSEKRSYDVEEHGLNKFCPWHYCKRENGNDGNNKTKSRISIGDRARLEATFQHQKRNTSPHKPPT